MKGVKIVRLPSFTDLRGSLLVAEHADHIPFIPKRVFLVYDVPTKEVRGEHAHKMLHQFLICISGSCSILLDDGNNREEIRLESKDIGIYIPPMVWSTQYKYTSDAILMVLASEPYNSEDYIREYQQYLSLVRK